MVGGRKKWLVSYSIRYISGEISELESTVYASTIEKALSEADRRLVKPGKLNMGVDKIVIWSVGIVDEDVF